MTHRKTFDCVCVQLITGSWTDIGTSRICLFGTDNSLSALKSCSECGGTGKEMNWHEKQEAKRRAEQTARDKVPTPEKLLEFATREELVEELIKRGATGFLHVRAGGEKLEVTIGRN